MVLRPLYWFALAICLIEFCTPALAGATPWLTDREMKSHAEKALVGKAYGTRIACKDSAKGPLLRITTANFPPGYKPMTGTDKFFRWYWVVAADSLIAQKIAGLRRKDKPHLTWRIVHRISYTGANGDKMTCAIIYR